MAFLLLLLVVRLAPADVVVVVVVVWLSLVVVTDSAEAVADRTANRQNPDHRNILLSLVVVVV